MPNTVSYQPFMLDPILDSYGLMIFKWESKMGSKIGHRNVLCYSLPATKNVDVWCDAEKTLTISQGEETSQETFRIPE